MLMEILIITIVIIIAIVITIVITTAIYKHTFKKIIKTLLPIITLIISLASPIISYVLYQRTVYDDEPSFNVIQNLWSSHPNYTLFNESKKKLSQPPHPTYIMVIPSKVIMQARGQTGAVSNLVLSPVSYTNTLSQVDTGQSIDKIETSTLPPEFFARKGVRDLVQSKVYTSNDKSKSIFYKVTTFPMLMIFTKVDYSYWGSNNQHTEYFVSTPVGKYPITSTDYKNIIQYITDNADLETPLKKDTSIYKTINESVLKKAKYVFSPEKGQGKRSDKDLLFLGGKAGGYGHVLKEMSGILPTDPITKKTN